MPLKRGDTVVVAAGADDEPRCGAGAEFEDAFPPPPLAAALPAKPSATTVTTAKDVFINATSPMKPFYLLLVALSYPDFRGTVS